MGNAAEIIEYGEVLARAGEIRNDEIESHGTGLTSLYVAAAVGDGRFTTPHLLIISSSTVSVEVLFREVGPNEELTYLRFCNEQNQKMRFYIATYVADGSLAARLLIPAEMKVEEIWVNIVLFLRNDALEIASGLSN